jgi:hypothetical protein
MQVLLNREVRSTQYSYTPNARDVACQCSPRPTPALRAVVLWGKRLLDVTQHPHQIRNGGWGTDTNTTPLERRGLQRESPRYVPHTVPGRRSRRVSLFRVLGSGSFEPHTCFNPLFFINPCRTHTPIPGWSQETGKWLVQPCFCSSSPPMNDRRTHGDSIRCRRRRRPTDHFPLCASDHALPLSALYITANA